MRNTLGAQKGGGHETGVGSGVLSAVVAGIAGLSALAQTSAAYADMGFSPGFLRDPSTSAMPGQASPFSSSWCSQRSSRRRSVSSVSGAWRGRDPSRSSRARAMTGRSMGDLLTSVFSVRAYRLDVPRRGTHPHDPRRDAGPLPSSAQVIARSRLSCSSTS